MDSIPDRPWLRFSILAAGLGLTLSVVYMLCALEAFRPPSNIRLHNDTGVTLLGVRVNGIDYGDLAAGAFSGYLPHPRAYRYAGLEAATPDEKIHSAEYCFYGEKILGAGKFTYKIRKMTYAESQADFEIRASRDAE